jgi:DNA ligase-1
MTPYTNTAVSIFQLIQDIAATASKNEKLALVKLGMQLPLFKRIVVAAYDPFKTYGIRELPEPAGIGEGAFSLDGDENSWAVLDQLASRELTGDEARTEVSVALQCLDASSAELFKRIILKDMRAGFTEGTINKAVPKTIPEFPYMRCSLPAKSSMDKWDWSKGQISQEKADGMFTNVDVDRAGQASLRTRQGQPLPRAGAFEMLHQDVERMLDKGTQSHGEALIFRDDILLPREENNGYLKHLVEGGALQPNERVELHLWDQIPLGCVEEGVCNTPYQARLVKLATQLRIAGASLIKMVETEVVYTKEAAIDHFRRMLRAGKEGTVVKNRAAIWKDGTSKDQVKFKLSAVVDLQITAIVPGKANTKNAGRPGSVTCTTSDGLLVTDVTVKNEKMRDAIEANPGDFIGRIIKVVFNTIMISECEEGEPHSLFLPRMEEDTYRLDKTVADSFQNVQDQYKAAIEAV